MILTHLSSCKVSIKKIVEPETWHLTTANQPQSIFIFDPDGGDAIHVELGLAADRGGRRVRNVGRHQPSARIRSD